MKTNLQFLSRVAFITSLVFFFISCTEDPGPDLPQLTGDKVEFTLSAASGSSISGTVTLAKLDDNSTAVTIDLNGTSSGNSHPSHIHLNSAAQGGSIAIDLTDVDGATGLSETNIIALNDDTAITYDELKDFDGYVNIHNSASDLGTLLAQGDIGINKLTGNVEDYELFSKSDPTISGEALLYERVSGESLLVIQLDGDANDSDRPSHIHSDNAVDGGGIVLSLSNVKAGVSKTHIEKLNDETPISYSELKEFDGYINVHNSSSDLGTLVAQGDFGQNKLTGDMVEYPLNSKSDPSISGTATFEERRNGETVVTLTLEGTPVDGDHPSHIHANTAVEGGGIVFSLSNVDGSTGISKTNVTAKNDQTPVTYDEMIAYNGYVNVHNSGSDLGTLIAQGDIGQNAFTGESVSYDMLENGGSGISGTITFKERESGATLVSIMLTGTASDGDHPAHIHNNSAATGGSIALNLNNVSGASGESHTQVTMLNDETPVSYDDLKSFNGHAKVHNSPVDLGTVVAVGDIGSNG